jgi:putative ABC transport system permease protein
MMFIMTLRIALRALGRNKIRSALTMLGVIIGVAAVIVVVAIGQGAAQSAQKIMASMGQNLLTILPGSTSSGAIQFGNGTAQTLSPLDETALIRECPSAEAAAVIIRTRVQIVYGNVNWQPATVQGCDPDYLTVRQWGVEEGDCFTEKDVKGAVCDCLIGTTVVANVFPNESPIGKRIRVKGLPFKVVGVLERKGSNAFGQDQDDVLLMPWTTCKKKIQGNTFNTVDQILMCAKSASVLDSLEAEIHACLREQHHCPKNLKGEVQEDFQIRNLTEILNAQAEQTKVMTMFLVAVAFVSLVVGGIGIMNIMLVSVTERTREIGLRMAVGARARDILAQFLVEAIALSGIGGTIGIILGWALSRLISMLAHWPSIVSPSSVVLSIGFSAAVGVFFGFYPAWRASELDPIDALRYE